MQDFTGAQKKLCSRLSVKKHSKPTPDIKKCFQYWNGLKCSEKCLKIQQQHFRPAQFSQQSPESEKSWEIFCRKYLFVSLKCRVPKFGVNRLQHSWVLCLPHVFKGTLCQFEKIAKRGAAVMGRQGRERGVARKHKAPLQEQAGAASWWCKAGNCLGTVQHWVGSALVHPRCAFHLTSQHLFSPPPSPKPPYLIFLLHFPLACSTQGLQLGNILFGG